MAKTIADGRFGGLDAKNIRELSNGAFEATIYLDGKKAGWVENDGRGGCHRYGFVDKDTRLAVEAECGKYSDWCGYGDCPPAELTDHTINAILDWKEDQKFAKSAKKGGCLFAAKLSQSDADRKATGKFEWELCYKGRIDGTPEQIAEALSEVREATPHHDTIEILMADGVVLDAPAVFPRQVIAA